MSQLEVIDREGWRRVLTVQKAIAFIGSHPQSDVPLESGRGGGVAPRHLQLISTEGGYRLVNLSDNDVELSGERRLAPRGTVELNDGDRFRLGDFNLTFYAGLAPEGAVGGSGDGALPSGSARAIGVSLRLPQTNLAPDQPIEGVVTVRNNGDKAGAQFRVEVEGLDADAYEIGPGPILYPNAQKEVFLRLMHPKKAQPPAGPHRVTVRATAPLAYPGESAVASQTITLLPYHHLTVRITAIE